MSSMPQRSLDDIYQIAPPAAYNRLKGFRERVPPRSYEVEKNIYQVWDMGQGERAALFLPSGMGYGEVWFPYLMELSADIRVIAISYPAQKTFEAYSRQIHQLLDQLGVKRVVLIAHAIGGLLAQTYVRMYPEETEAMILCMSGAPAKGLDPQAREKWTRRKKLYWNYMLSPFDPLRRRMGYQTYYNMCPPEMEENLIFWRAFISETYEYHIYKKQFVYINCRALPDIYERLPFDKGDLDGWKGRVLILRAQRDQYYPASEQELLEQLYPNARVEELGPTGQMALLADERRAVSLMRSFLRERA